jgi:hypothetical protein
MTSSSPSLGVINVLSLTSFWFYRDKAITEDFRKRYLCRDWFIGISHFELCIRVSHPSVLLNKEKICHEISENKIAVCEKTQGLRSGNFSDLNSACSKVLVPFQFHDKSERYRDAANSLLVVFTLHLVELCPCGMHVVAFFTVLLNKSEYDAGGPATCHSAGAVPAFFSCFYILWLA